MIIEEDQLKFVLEAVAKKLNVDKKWRYVKRKQSDDLVNFAAILLPVSLIDETKGKEFNLLIKTAPDWPVEKVVDELFIKEYHFYTKVLPIYKCMKTNIDIDNLFPECYYADSSPDHRVLAIQDMTFEGFEKPINRENLDYKYMTVALETIAKFHALSFIMMKKNVTYTNKKSLQPLSAKYSEDFTAILKYAINKSFFIFKDKYYFDFLEKLCGGLEKYMEDGVDKAKGKVYGHGDFYKENILFKYSNGVPVDACLIDFQHTRSINLAQDILFLIMTSTDAADRKLHFHDYLNYYYESLHSILKSNGVEVSVGYSYEDFEYDLKLAVPVCLIITVFSYTIWCGVIDLECSMSPDKVPPPIKEKDAVKVGKLVDHLMMDFVDLGYLPELR
ncbi:unnamed protein product [Chilo suppressalis]|uniref:CHK kinase-like domain-containing protein n=1 Tax=Chilo suppressalis TaxID=168631 RepID=A0ABN8L923_CHISP|nr:unnamed protein product [Chilo suppressalis]